MMHGLANFKFLCWIYAAGLYLIATKFRIFCSSPDVIGVIKGRRTRQAKHVESIEKKIMYAGILCENLKKRSYLKN
jgi:hypothetical protein